MNGQLDPIAFVKTRLVAPLRSSREGQVPTGVFPRHSHLSSSACNWTAASQMRTGSPPRGERRSTRRYPAFNPLETIAMKKQAHNPVDRKVSESRPSGLKAHRRSLCRVCHRDLRVRRWMARSRCTFHRTRPKQSSSPVTVSDRLNKSATIGQNGVIWRDGASRWMVSVRRRRPTHVPTTLRTHSSAVRQWSNKDWGFSSARFAHQGRENRSHSQMAIHRKGG